MFATVIRLISGSFAVFAFVAAADSRATDNPFLPAGTSADAPFGYTEMCERDPALCFKAAGTDVANRPAQPQACAAPAGSQAAMYWRVSTASMSVQCLAPAVHIAQGAAPVMSEADRHKLIKQVNRKVNRAVIQVADYDFTGQQERWQRPAPGRSLVGDCEDIAIEKRMRLIEQGFDADRLFYATVYRRGFGLHTVLIARTDDGDWVLDSLTGKLRRWNATGYTWLRTEVAGRPGEWQTVGRRAAPVQYAAIGLTGN